MKFKFHPQNLPLLAGALVDTAVVIAHVDNAIKIPVVAAVTALCGVLGWTE